MLSEQEIAGLLDGSLSPEEQARLCRLVEDDPDVRRQLREQFQMDNVLRVTVGSAAANERVKQSVLAVVRGESEAAIKQHVLDDTTFLSRSRRREEAQTSRPSGKVSLLTSAATNLFESLRRPAWALSFAAACLCLGFGAWFALRSNRPHTLSLAAAVETPVRVDYPKGTTILSAPNTKIQHDGSAGSFTPRSGDGLRVSEFSSATIRFADGTVLHLEPRTEVRFQPVANPPRNGGKQLKLLSGALSADVAKQPPGLPLLIETPHALVTVVGTEFDLNVATNQTELEVTRGLVKLADTDATQPVSVAAGEFAVAAPQTAMRYGRLARNPYLWPFSSASIWNRPLGSGAKFAPVPGKSFLADGPLVGAWRWRRPFRGTPSDPLRRIWVNGEPRADVRLAEAHLPRSGMTDAIVLLQQGRRYALELRGVNVRADGDLEAADMERILLNGPGLIDGEIPALPFGLSNLGGLVRAGELERGIPHALSARVNRERLAGWNFAKPATVWPVNGSPAEASGDGRLAVGTLLAIPPDVDIRALAGESGPGFELARAMQDYGVYITGFIDAPFVLLAAEPQLTNADELLTKLVPQLQIVTNHRPETPGGGGTARRESAPALPDESK